MRVQLKVRGLFVALFAVVSMFWTAAYSATQATIYVSTTGNDSANGSAGAPVRSLHRARDIVRGMTATMTGDIIISVGNGRYYLPSTLSLGDQDSGKNGYRVIYKSAAGVRASISGGILANGGWLSVGGGIYKKNVGSARFRQLYVNGQRAIRARNPDSGFAKTVRFDIAGNKIVISNGLIPAVANLNQVEMVLHKEWTQSNYLISSISRYGAEATLSFLNPTTLSFSTLVEGNVRPFFLENAREFLNSPGEWYLNTPTNELFYMPRSGENMATVEVVIPSIENIINIQQAHDITFTGLTFEHSNWTAPSNGGMYARQGSRAQLGTTSGVIASAITVKDSSRINFERNLVRHTGGIGLGLVSGVNNSSIIGNVFRETAASGIAVDRAMPWGVYKSTTPVPLTSSQCQNITIKNNYLTMVSRDYESAEAIFVGYAGYINIEHNLVKDVPYIGISAGWGWSDVDQPQKNINIRYNRIDHAMANMSDGGAIYTLSKNPGTLVSENHILNMSKGAGAGSNPFGHSFVGIYFDEGSSLLTARNNVYDNIGAPGLNLYLQIKFSATATGASKNTIYNHYGPIYGSTSANTFITDGTFNAAAVRANAGLEAAYADIVNLGAVVAVPTPQPPPTPTPTPIPTPTPFSGPFKLKAAHSGKCLDSGASSANLVAAYQYDCFSVKNQTYDLHDKGGGYYEIASQFSGKCLDITRSDTTNGAIIIQYTCSGTPNQLFRFEAMGSGKYRILSKLNNKKCIDIDKASTANSAKVQIWDCHGGPNQNFFPVK